MIKISIGVMKVMVTILSPYHLCLPNHITYENEKEWIGPGYIIIHFGSTCANKHTTTTAKSPKQG